MIFAALPSAAGDGNLFGRAPSPTGTRPRDVFPRRRPQAACASCTQSGATKMVRKERDTLPEDISIGGTG
ncbi:hypothetical protein EOS93_18330 [Rhizobium sp. RMa-01]|nr:hypothetical protein EOS93_18330 [Rhizobium sp. RMa-01]